MRCGRVLIGAALVFFGGLTLQQCTSSATTPQAAEATLDLKPYVSVKELMENIVDPAADVLFDSVVTTVTAAGVVETRPTTEEDWLKVQRAALLLAEATNLLKIPRQVAPAGDQTPEGGPELPPAQMQARVDGDRTQWNKYADGLREVAVRSLSVAKAKDVNGLFEVGSDLDKACENCHLEYWYPGDKKK
jgi:hypothetical protein